MNQKYKYKKQIAIGIGPDGKQIRKWIYSNSKDDLIAQKVRLQDEFKNGGMATDPYWIDYAGRWKDVHTATQAPATRAITGHCIDQCEALHYQRLSKITPLDCQELLNTFFDRPDLAKRIALVMRQIFAEAVNDGRLKRNPADNLKLPKKVKQPKRVLTDEEIKIVRKLLTKKDPRLSDQEKMFLTMLYYFGLRPEEARALTVDDFDFEAETVTIQRALSYTENQGDLRQTKTGNVRTLPIPRACASQIRAFCGKVDSLYLFTNERGLVHSKTSYRHLWEHHIRKQIIEAGGGDDITPYIFRRNYATNLYYSGISLKKAAYLLGHSSTRMIMEVYAQIDDDRENLDALKNMK